MSLLSPYRHHITLTLLCSAYVLIAWDFIALDLWSDELYTLENFVFVPLVQTVSDYHVPNNHVFFSLLLSLYTDLLTIDSIGAVLNRPWFLRLLMLAISMATIALSYLTSERIKSGSGLFTGVVLITSIPFINFSLQVRGYSLTLLLLAGLLFVISSRRISKGKLIWITVLTTLLAYTIPSNYYLIIALTAPSALLYLLTKQLQWLKISVSMLVGAALSLLLFAPIFKQVFFNRFVTTSYPFNPEPLTSFIPWIIQDMIGGRYFMLVLGVMGLAFLLFRRLLNNKHDIAYALIASITIPFLVSFIRGDHPFMRSFVFMVVPFAIILGLAVTAVVQNVRYRHWIYWIALITLSFEGVLAFLFQMQNSEDECRYNISNQHRAEDLGTCYFQHRYQPQKDVANFHAYHTEMPAPLVIHRTQAHDLRFYLEPYHIQARSADSLEAMLQKETQLYVVSENPLAFINNLQDDDPRWEATIINEKLTYHTFIALEKDTTLSQHIARINGQAKRNDLPIIALSQSEGGYFSQKMKNSAVFDLEVDEELFMDNFNRTLMQIAADSVIIMRYNCDSCERINPIIAAQFKSYKSLVNTSHLDVSLNKPRMLSNAPLVANDTMQELNPEQRYSTPLALALSEDHLKQGTFFTHTCDYELSEGAKLILVVSIKNTDETYHWKGLEFLSQDSIKQVNTYFHLPTSAKSGDMLEVYFWLQKGDRAIIVSPTLRQL